MKSTQYHKTVLAAFVCATISSTTALAKAGEKAPSNPNMLPEIVVYGNQNKSLSSTETVTAEDMAKTPASNGNITDYLRSNPHVRYENSDQNGRLRGEIKPENISINGADASQTAYFVDNVNVNNDIGGEDLSGFFDGNMATMPQVQGGQGYFFDANMLSKVEVHDSNVSASLGGFMGGAVVAKTKQYSGHDGVKIRYRTTNSNWAKLHIDDYSRKTLEDTSTLDEQRGKATFEPKYRKHFFSIVAEKGLTDNLGMVVGFSRRTSHLDQTRVVTPPDQINDIPAKIDSVKATRRSDNAMLNFNYTPTNNDRLELSLRYSDYREGKFWHINTDSDLFDHHTAYGSTLAWVHDFTSGTLTTTLAYDKLQDKRKSNSTTLITYFSSVTDDPIKQYDKGGMGNSALTQHNYHFSTEYAVNPFDLGSISHSISFGNIYQFTRFDFEREKEAKSYFYDPTNPPYNIAKAGKVRTSYQNIAFYAEDLMRWKNIEVRPGLRIERDNYLKNTNIAPRFVTKYKPWEDTGLILGLNRYYGRSFASMKLTEEIFKLDGHDDRFKYNDIRSFKTPYADELSLGLEQNIGNFALKLNYIHRKNKNRIHLETDPNAPDKRYYRQAPDYGVDVYTFETSNIKPYEIGNTYWNATLGFDWLKSKRADIRDSSSLVILDGKLMTFKDMENKVNSRNEDWVARLGLDMLIPDYNITWSNKIYIKSPVRYADLVNDSVSPNIYRKVENGIHTQWDSSLRWQPNITGSHSVYVQLDILNVLNKTRKNIIKFTPRSAETSDDYGAYTPGREFWLEVGYQF